MTTAAAEQFQGSNPNVNITVGISGTGGGFERFCAGETDLSDASRPIKTDPADKEATVCASNGIDYTEFLVANDGITLVVNKDNTWAKCLTTAQLKKIWEPKSKVTNWNQVDPSFPEQSLKLFGPGTDSGTFDYFTDSHQRRRGRQPHRLHSRPRTTTSWSRESPAKGRTRLLRLRLLRAEPGQAQGRPGRLRQRLHRADRRRPCSDGNVRAAFRPLFIYAKNSSFKRPEVEAFMRFVIDNEEAVSSAAGLISLTADEEQKAKDELDTAVQAAGA